MKRRKIHGRINQWQLITVIYTSIQKISAKVWTYSFVAVILHPHHRMTFHEWIKNISPAVNREETVCFRNHEGSHYDAMPSVWKNMSVLFRRKVMCIIDSFLKEAPTGKYPWTKKMFFLSFIFSLDEIPKIDICHMETDEYPEVTEGRRRLIAVMFLNLRWHLRMLPLLIMMLLRMKRMGVVY